MNCDCPTLDCGCDGHDALLSGWFLGALTPDAAAQQAMPKSTIRGKAGFTQAVYDEIVNAASSGQFTDYNAQASSCVNPASHTAQTALALVSTGSGLALQGAVMSGLVAAGPATFGITIAIAGITALFSTIFNHHAQAVAKENRILCASGPAANNYLQIIEQAVQSGVATPQQGIEALQSLLADYSSTIRPIIKNNSSQCNAACVELKELTAIVAYKQSEYQDLATAAAQTLTPARPNTTSPAGVSVPASSYASFYGQPATTAPASSSDWMPIAAIIALGFLVMRGL
jgi:hypothetical protein